MTDVSNVKAYRPGTPARIEGGEARYFREELVKIQNSIDSIKYVLELLEARIEVLEP